MVNAFTRGCGLDITDSAKKGLYCTRLLILVGSAARRRLKAQLIRFRPPKRPQSIQASTSGANDDDNGQGSVTKARQDKEVRERQTRRSDDDFFTWRIRFSPAAAASPEAYPPVLPGTNHNGPRSRLSARRCERTPSIVR